MYVCIELKWVTVRQGRAKIDMILVKNWTERDFKTGRKEGMRSEISESLKKENCQWSALPFLNYDG